MEIIVPAAGLSTRFPDMKPKYLLYDYRHKLMIYRALEPYLQYNITVGILKEHDEKFNAKEFLDYEFDNKLNVVILDKLTNGPADTVYQIIKKSNIDLNSEIFIKDCDSFFDHKVSSGSYVCVSKISKHEVLKRVAQKSFVISNEQGIITDIIEKNIISDTFCVGGYKFESASMYVNLFEEVNTFREIFVSDVIQRALFHKNVITENQVENYFDVGTSEEWFSYNDKPVIFCDIDGTLIKNQTRVGENSFDSPFVALTKNVELLLEYQKDGSQFVFTTSRPKKYEVQTRKILDELGFKNYELIIGLLNSKRIIINDFNKNNPYPRAESINIERDTETLNYFMEKNRG